MRACQTESPNGTLWKFVLCDEELLSLIHTLWFVISSFLQRTTGGVSGKAVKQPIENTIKP